MTTLIEQEKPTEVKGTEVNKNSVCENSNVKKLYGLFVEKGIESSEFLDYCRKYLVFLLMKNYGYYNDDLVQACFKRVLFGLMNHYDAKKSNIGSFIFSGVRNEAASYFGKKARTDLECEISRELPYQGTFNEVPVALHHCMERFRNITIPNQLKLKIKDNVLESRNTDNVMYKLALWDSLTNE